MIESVTSYNDLVEFSKENALESYKKAINLASILKSQLITAANAAVKLEKDTYWINNADTSWYVDKDGNEIDYLGEYYTMSINPRYTAKHDVSKVWLKPGDNTTPNENGEIFVKDKKTGVSKKIGIVDPRLDEYTIDTPEKLAGLAKIVLATNANFSECTLATHGTIDVVQCCAGINFFSKSNAESGLLFAILIKLGNDIDLSGKLWSSIGSMKDTKRTTESKPFQGSFDGNNYTISNLTIEEPEQIGVGLFGYFAHNRQYTGGFNNYAKNVNLENVSIKGGMSIGAFVGHFDAVSIENVNLKNINLEQVIKTNESAYMGGLVGKMSTTSSIKNVAMTGMNILRSRNLKSQHIGGILGYSGDTVLKLGNISVSGLFIDVQGNAGGIAGTISFETELENCVVKNSEIRVTRVNPTGSYGDDAGGLYAFSLTNTNGYRLATLKNCQVINTKVSTTSGNAYNIADPAYYTALASIEKNSVRTYYYTLEDAITAAESGDVITLYEQEYKTSTGVTINKNTTIIGAGKGKTKISSALDNSTNSGILYVNGGTDILENVTLKVATLVFMGSEQLESVPKKLRIVNL